MIAAASHCPQVGHPLEDGGRRRVKGLLGDTTVTAVRNNFPFESLTTHAFLWTIYRYVKKVE